jgi:hypothetical protein
MLVVTQAQDGTADLVMDALLARPNTHFVTYQVACRTGSRVRAVSSGDRPVIDSYARLSRNLSGELEKVEDQHADCHGRRTTTVTVDAATEVQRKESEMLSQEIEFADPLMDVEDKLPLLPASGSQIITGPPVTQDAPVPL